MLQKICCLLLSFSLFSTDQVYLKTPDLSLQKMISTNVGVRPYRKSGVRIEAEKLENKLVIHNYGYGGSGLTLCFGGSQEVLDILHAQNPPSKKVAVLGAGVAGLAVSYDLLKQGYEVSIYADNWSPHLTSNVGAGIWSPAYLPDDAPSEKKALNQRLLQTSKERYLKSVGEDPEFKGVRLIDSYSVRCASSEEAIKTKHVGEDIFIHFDNGVVKMGKKTQELGIDGKLFMEDLYSQVKTLGASIKARHFENLQDLALLEEPILINCMSMGSKPIFQDEEFLPVRGQLIYFEPQEGIDYLFYQNIAGSTTSWVSIYPWSDRIILGGVYEKDETAIENTPEILKLILENGQKCLLGEF